MYDECHITCVNFTLFHHLKMHYKYDQHRKTSLSHVTNLSFISVSVATSEC